MGEGLSTTLLLTDFIQLALACLTVILSIRVILRVEKKLDLFFKLLLIAAVFVVVREILEIFDHMNVIEAAWFTRPLEVVPLTVIVIAYLVMNSIVLKLDRER